MMNSAHAGISNLDAMLGLLLSLQWWMTGHYGWLVHSFANHAHLALWRHLSALLTDLNWLAGHWPATPCKSAGLCPVG